MKEEVASSYIFLNESLPSFLQFVETIRVVKGHTLPNTSWTMCAIEIVIESFVNNKRKFCQTFNLL